MSNLRMKQANALLDAIECQEVLAAKKSSEMFDEFAEDRDRRPLVETLENEKIKFLIDSAFRSLKRSLVSKPVRVGTNHQIQRGVLIITACITRPHYSIRHFTTSVILDGETLYDNLLSIEPTVFDLVKVVESSI